MNKSAIKAKDWLDDFVKFSKECDEKQETDVQAAWEFLNEAKTFIGLQVLEEEGELECESCGKIKKKGEMGVNGFNKIICDDCD